MVHGLIKVDCPLDTARIRCPIKMSLLVNGLLRIRTDFNIDRRQIILHRIVNGDISRTINMLFFEFRIKVKAAVNITLIFYLFRKFKTNISVLINGVFGVNFACFVFQLTDLCLLRLQFFR